jgi:hypothetical protein
MVYNTQDYWVSWNFLVSRIQDDGKVAAHYGLVRRLKQDFSSYKLCKSQVGEGTCEQKRSNQPMNVDVTGN